MKKLLSGPIIINAILFQITWFACALGSAHNLLWPALISCCVLAAYQLHNKRRHDTDLKLVAIAIVLGLLIDSSWLQLNLISYSAQAPFSGIAPLWIITLWIGFALTINHSLSWLSQHPLLPAISGLIFAPLSYFAAEKLGAISFIAEPIVIIITLGVAWAIAMSILVRASKT